jgi:hypothetical protein
MAKNDKPAAKVKASGAQGKAKDTALVGAPKSSADIPSTTSTRGLVVSSNLDGYRRGGRAWTKQPITIARDDLSEEQFNQVIEDANLTVEFVDLPLQSQAA